MDIDGNLIIQNGGLFVTTFQGKVAVLDLQLFIDEDGLFKYEFYEKPCTSKFVMPESSAHSKKMKMSVLVEEGVRRMRNCS